MIRRLTLAVAAALVATALAPRVHAADALQIDAILPLTGNGAALGAKGRAALNAIERRVDARGGVDGRPIHFVVHDDRSDPLVASAVASGIGARGVPVLLGSSLVGICGAIARVVENAGPLRYCFASGFSPAAGGYHLREPASTSDLMRASLRFVGHAGGARLALVTTSDPGGREARDALLRAVDLPENRGVSIVDAEAIADVNAQSAREAVRRVLDAQPTIIMMWSVGSPATIVLKAAAETGTTIPVLTAPAASP